MASAFLAGRILLVLAALCAVPAATLAADYQATIEALTRDLPRDAADLIVRRIDCNHWAGEEATDKERGQEIKAAIDKLRCRTIEEDERVLRRLYADNPKVLRSLEQARSVEF